MFFKSKEEKEKSKKEKINKKASSAEFMGKCIQNVGNIPSGSFCSLKIDPYKSILTITHNKVTAEIPLERILGFSLDDEIKLKSGKTSIGGAIIGGALFGGSGAIIGSGFKKGNTEKRWIGTLLYKSISGETEEINFIASGVIGEYKGNSPTLMHLNFQSALSNLLLQDSPDRFTL